MCGHAGMMVMCQFIEYY